MESPENFGITSEILRKNFGITSEELNNMEGK